MDPEKSIQPSDSAWSGLIRAGGLAALAAGILFRRNLGAEISLFSAQKQPAGAAGWFALLESNRLLGLAYLHIFDVVNYLLVGLMFLALFVLLRRWDRSLAALGLACGAVGITVFFSTNTALSLLALSDQYAAAQSAEQRAALEAAGQALLAVSRFSSPGAQPGSGGYLSLLLTATATLLFSSVMLRSRTFPRAAGWVGIAAGALDLAYCAAFVLVPRAGELLAVLFIPAAGLLLMLWHILVGWRITRLGRAAGIPAPRAV